MFPSQSLLSCLLLALSVANVNASPLTREPKATLKFTRNFKLSVGFGNLAEQDRARAQFKKQQGSLGKRDTSFSVTNAQTTYTAQVGIGSPATQYTLLIDTGSSNTWVGAGKAYTPTSSSVDTGNTVSVSYGSGNFTGEEWTDTVTLAPGLVIDQQSIGVASQANGINDGIDGILGVGPTDLTHDTVSNTNEVPTVTDSLFNQGTIYQKLLGVYYVPASSSNTDGELTFGSVDYSVIRGVVNYVPITTTSPASEFWGVDQSITYGTETILSSTAGIVDTGTTLLLIATDAFQKYQSVTGGVMDSATGLLSITSDQYEKLQPLDFKIGDATYRLSANAQIWPRSLNTDIGGSADSIYLIVSDIGTPSGSGLDFINGYTFLERFYTVYDTDNKAVGFAETENTNANTN